jgi:hypothetical protein
MTNSDLYLLATPLIATAILAAASGLIVWDIVRRHPKKNRKTSAIQQVAMPIADGFSKTPFPLGTVFVEVKGEAAESLRRSIIRTETGLATLIVREDSQS